MNGQGATAADGSAVAGFGDVDPRPRLCFVGPHLARHPGWVTTQSEVVSALFADEGYEVRATSSIRSPWLRTLDMLLSIARWHRHIDLIVLSVFSGRAFLYADLLGRLARRLGLKQVFFLHGGDLPELARQAPKRMQQVLARADMIVAPSPFLARMAEDLGLSAIVIPNVLELSEYPFKPRRQLTEPIKILWMRTFHPIYHPELALDVLHRLCRRGLDAELTMAGQDKGLESTCRAKARELALQDRVRFVGFLGATAKAEVLEDHDIYLHTNRVDNTPVTVLEAAACGLPVVATRVGGMADLLLDAGILITPPDDPELMVEVTADAMADAIEELIRNPEEVERLSTAGRALAESYAWPAVHRRWRRLFRRLGPERSGESSP